MKGRSHARALAVLAAGALTVGFSATAATATTTATATATATTTTATATTTTAGHPAGCALGPDHSIRHVIYIQFDNVHFRRDDPNVPSDLEQMPNLLRFITGHGTLISHE